MDKEKQELTKKADTPTDMPAEETAAGTPADTADDTATGDVKEADPPADTAADGTAEKEPDAPPESESSGTDNAADDTAEKASDAEEAKAPAKKKRKWVLPVILLCIVAVGAIVGSQVYMHSDSYLQSQLLAGRQHLNAGEYEQARTAYNKANSADAENAEAYTGLIESYGGLGNVEAVVSTQLQAEQRLSAEALTPVSDAAVRVLSKIGQEQVADGDLEGAVSTAKQAQSLAEDTADAVDGAIGSALMDVAKEAEGDDAAGLYEMIVDADPKNVDAYVALIDPCLEAEDYEAAISWIEQGLSHVDSDILEGKKSEIPYAIAEGLRFSNAYEVTFDDYNFALVDETGSADAYPETAIEKGEATLKVESIEEASADGNHSVTITGTSEIHPAVTLAVDETPYIEYAVPGCYFLDYYTGLKFPAAVTTEDGTFSDGTNVYWKYDSYPVTVTTEQTWEKDWSDYTTTGNMYTETYNAVCHFRITVTFPEGYDGTVMYCAAEPGEGEDIDPNGYFMRLPEQE